MDYQVIDLGFDFGTKFLTEDAAYFLGLLMADEREEFNGVTYWFAPIRHNPKQYEIQDLESHYIKVKNMAKTIQKNDMTQMTDFLKNQGFTLGKFNMGKKGIVTLFEVLNTDYKIEDLVYDISEQLLSSSKDVQRSFIIGLFDGRGSYDGSSFIAVDFDNDSVKDLVVRCLTNLGIEPNINDGSNSRKREKPDSTPRKKQIRIKHINYLSNIGYVSDVRFKKATVKVLDKFSIKEVGTPLYGVKIIEPKHTQQTLFQKI
ncbi:LAGLIDADG family homing endonuclease [Pseudalkalibacillus sp. Hm43]|uniref:LAGLIDADG family homing endonuclease n=1 Tax=Pseudalkalibacillus sp. Hm43 TaxID=3450742 RepID=UPI003F425884